MDWPMVKRQEVRAYVSLLPHIFLSVRTRRTSVRMRKGARRLHISAKKSCERMEFLCRAPMENAASGIDFSRCV